METPEDLDPGSALVPEGFTHQMALAAKVLISGRYRKGQRRRDGCMKLAAERAGVDRKTIRNWLEKEWFYGFVIECSCRMDDAADDGLIKSMRSGAAPAVNLKWKAMQDPEQFDPKLKLEKAKHNMRMREEREKKKALVAAAAHLPEIVIEALPMPDGEVVPDFFKPLADKIDAAQVEKYSKKQSSEKVDPKNQE